jgi:hypothetical protein
MCGWMGIYSFSGAGHISLHGSIIISGELEESVYSLCKVLFVNFGKG